MEAYGDTADEAAKNIRHYDEARASYYKNISELTWGDRTNYELMLNSSIGLEESPDITCHYVQIRKSKNGLNVNNLG